MSAKPFELAVDVSRMLVILWMSGVEPQVTATNSLSINRSFRAAQPFADGLQSEICAHIVQVFDARPDGQHAGAKGAGCEARGVVGETGSSKT